MPISVEEWTLLISAHADLRLRAKPYLAVNPKSGARIQLPIGEADSDFLCGEEWLPFLRFNRGRLVTEFQAEFENPRNALRVKIADVAKQLGAVVATDAGDEVLEW